MIWINTEDVICIHNRIIEKTKGIEGIRDLHGLEAAIAAPLQTFSGQDLFPTDTEKIARLGYGLAANHAFLDGNKRIGAMMTQLLLKWNPSCWSCSRVNWRICSSQSQTVLPEKRSYYNGLKLIERQKEGTKDDEFRTRGSSRRIKSNRTM